MCPSAALLTFSHFHLAWHGTMFFFLPLEGFWVNSIQALLASVGEPKAFLLEISLFCLDFDSEKTKEGYPHLSFCWTYAHKKEKNCDVFCCSFLFSDSMHSIHVELINFWDKDCWVFSEVFTYTSFAAFRALADSKTSPSPGRYCSGGRFQWIRTQISFLQFSQQQFWSRKWSFLFL